MKAKYIFRLDDIAENMNWKNFNRIKAVFLKYNIKPIIGVIPNNQDKTLLKYPKTNINFWEKIRRLQRNKHWSVALHGYNHVYETKNSGLLQINEISEYAGLSRDRQNDKIVKGKRVFLDKEILIDAFMAPAHSFDETTLKCLKEHEINVVTDGYALFPYYNKGILFVPQLSSKPRKMPFGIFTWCLHLNTMSDKNLEEVIEFIHNNHENIISFSQAKKHTKNSICFKVLNFLLKKIFIMYRKSKGLLKR